MAKRADSDEHYVIDLCDAILGVPALRGHRLDCLRGDRRGGGKGACLPVDACYEPLKLVVEYYERQHTEAVTLFDTRMTVSGVTRGEQRRIYDEKRRTELPKHGYRLVVVGYEQLQHDARKRLSRDRDHDLRVFRGLLAAYGQAVSEG
jgi:hypothetical protein